MTETLAHNITEAAAIAGSSRTSLYEAMRRGDLRAVKHGSRTLILAEDLKAWLASLPAYQPASDRSPS